MFSENTPRLSTCFVNFLSLHNKYYLDEKGVISQSSDKGITSQKLKFFIKDFLSKCDHGFRKFLIYYRTILRIEYRSISTIHSLKKYSLDSSNIENQLKQISSIEFYFQPIFLRKPVTI